MTNATVHRYKPALLGALFIGVLSSLPGIMAGNCCCCLWVASGGMLTAHLMQQRQEAPLETQDAVLSALLAGALGAVLAFILGLIFWAMLGSYQERLVLRFIELLKSLPNLPPEAKLQLDSVEPQGVTLASELFRFVVSVPVYMIFSMLGALLGLALFRKKLPPQPPVA